MPFTGSHPAAVLPFLRTPLPASALVIGSMAPDLPYFVPVDFPWATHTATAVVTLDVLIGGAAWLVWHGVLAAPALATAPGPVRARLAGVPVGPRLRPATAGGVGLLLLALVLGSVTHVLWDEFTHPHRWATTHIPVLAHTWWLLPGYRWAQYLSSVAGLAILAVWLVRWWRRAPARPVRDHPAARWAWAVPAGVAVLVGGLAAVRAPSIGSAAYAGATWGGGAALAVALVLALAWHARRVGAPA